MAHSWLRWELAGIPLIFFAGSALHFAFEWCGRLAVVAPFVPVNESVWEHLKLAYWPALLYAAVEYVAFRRDAAGLVLAKSAGILLMPVLIVVLFYAYTALLGHHLLVLDILLFLVAVAAGQLLSGMLPNAAQGRAWASWAALLAVALLGVAFAVFTFAPPRLPVFRDPVSGGYGLQEGPARPS